MSHIPFIGRLHPAEYFALVASFFLLFLEVIVRTITLALPGPIIRVFYLSSRRAFNSLSSPRSKRNRSKKKSVSSPIAQAQDFVEICELYGYYAEEHIVQTKDGFLLGLHRLGWRRGEEDVRVNAGPGSVEKKVVYLHHGLMMNSEVWVCITEKERCLPFVLVEQGYDVWLGNNRGNKYSKKSLKYSPTEVPFWNFSMDQFAFHDIPDSIDYVLSTTQQPSLSYIGFSQGTAQAFAALSIHPTLNHKVDVFVALAPAMAPPGLASGVVSSFVKSSPEVLFLAFGRKAILGSATMWQALLYPAIFIFFIDRSLRFLFGWKTQNITAHQKLAAYPHLYSFTSTKSVVHWFQIIRNGTFQMFDDEVTSPLQMSNGSKYYKVAKFPTRNIKTPIVLVYGGSDSLVDIKLMLKELPKHTIAKEIEKYEHLDLLWASDVDQLVFPHVLEALESYAQPEKTKSAALGWRPLRQITASSPVGSQPPGYSEDERVRQGGVPSHGFDFALDHRPSTADENEQLDESEFTDTDTERYALTPERHRTLQISQAPSGGRTVTSDAGSSSRTVTSPKRRILSPRLRSREGVPLSPVTASAATDSTARRSAPEGWWSSDTSVHESANIRPTSARDSYANDVDSSPSTGTAADGRVSTPTPSGIPRATGRQASRKASDASLRHSKGFSFSSKSSPITGPVNAEPASPARRSFALGNGSESESKSEGKKRARKK